MWRGSKEKGATMAYMTLIYSTQPKTLGKSYKLGDDGKLTKNSVANVWEGMTKAHNAESPEQLAEVLRQVCEKRNIALMSGRFFGSQPKELVKLVTKKKLAELLGIDVADVPGGVQEIDDQKYAARLKRGIELSAWVLIDADNPKGIPTEWASLNLQERLEMLEPIVPGISTCARVEYRSSSARVVKNGEEPGGASHGWIQISDAAKVEILREHFKVHMQLIGASFPSPRFSRDKGNVIGSEPRTVIDIAVWAPGRLVFCSRPEVLAEGYYVTDAGVKIVNPQGGPLDVSSLEIPSKAVLKRLSDKTGQDLSYAFEGNSLTVKDRSSLTWNTPIEIKGAVRTLRAIVENPPNAGKIRCETPFRASQSEAAFIRILDDGTPMLYDVGTSTSYFLATDSSPSITETELSSVSKEHFAVLLANLPGGSEGSDEESNITWGKTPVKALIKDKQRLVFSKNVPLQNQANAIEVVRHSEEWDGILAYNELSEQIVLLQPIPGSYTPRTSFKPRAVLDQDFVRAVAWFNKNGFPTIGKHIVIDALETVAHETVISPIRHYLEGLEKTVAWNPKTHPPKLVTMFQDYFGTIRDGTTPGSMPAYLAAVSIKFMVSAVARALNPGCKVDTMLVLEGLQGMKKSSAVRTLFGADYFSDNLPQMGTKDASDHIRGKWIIEVGELSAMQKSEVEAIKAFVTRQEEKFRPAYARKSITYHRRCVFIGTTNQDAYLRDETGNRRFWPVKVGTIDLKALERDRDALWSEAVHRYRNGEIWHLTVAEEALAREVQTDRVAVDLWQERLAEKLSDKTEISLTDAAGFIGLEVSKVNRADQNRIVACLKALGFERKGKFSSGAARHSARYVLMK